MRDCINRLCESPPKMQDIDLCKRVTYLYVYIFSNQMVFIDLSITFISIESIYMNAIETYSLRGYISSIFSVVIEVNKFISFDMKNVGAIL